MKLLQISAVVDVGGIRGDQQAHTDRGQDPFDVLVHAMKSEWSHATRGEDESVRGRVEELRAELWAICVWDRDYFVRWTDNEIERAAWQARRLRLGEIQEELDDLRAGSSRRG